jgi:hypothetical protein
MESETLERVRAYSRQVRGLAGATMLPDVRELLTAVVDGLDQAIAGE